MDKDQEHLQKLRAMADSTKTPGQSSDVVIAGMIVEFGELVVSLSKTLDRTNRLILWATLVGVVLTVGLVALTVVLVVLPFFHK